MNSLSLPDGIGAPLARAGGLAQTNRRNRGRDLRSLIVAEHRAQRCRTRNEPF
jgi:hypothetical protein